MTGLLRGRRLGEPAAATVTPPPLLVGTAVASSSRLSAEVKWQVKWPLPDAVDEVTEGETGARASDVNDDEEDELPHLDDALEVMAAEAVVSAERKETERRGDEEEDDDAIPLAPDRTDVATIFIIIFSPIPTCHIFHEKETKQNNR